MSTPIHLRFKPDTRLPPGEIAEFICHFLGLDTSGGMWEARVPPEWCKYYWTFKVKDGRWHLYLDIESGENAGWNVLWWDSTSVTPILALGAAIALHMAYPRWEIPIINRVSQLLTEGKS